MLNKTFADQMQDASRSPFAETMPEGSGPLDEELVAQAQAGDKDALERLVRRHQPWVFNIAIRMMWRRDLAEDATQEILIKIVTKLSTFRGESQFRTWLYRIAVNHLLNVRKSEMEEKSMTFTDCAAPPERTRIPRSKACGVISRTRVPLVIRSGDKAPRTDSSIGLRFGLLVYRLGHSDEKAQSVSPAGFEAADLR